MALKRSSTLTPRSNVSLSLYRIYCLLVCTLRNMLMLVVLLLSYCNPHIGPRFTSSSHPTFPRTSRPIALGPRRATFCLLDVLFLKTAGLTSGETFSFARPAMVPDGVFLAACVVPPVCLVLVIVWTLVVLRRFRRLAASTGHPPPSLAQFRPSHPVFSPPAPPAFVHAPTPPRGQPVNREELFSVLPPAQPGPGEQPFSIHTTLSRSGTRVLARNASSSQGHTPTTAPSSNSHQELEAAWKRLSGTSKQEHRRSKPERTRRGKGKFGVGDGDDDEWVDVAPGSAATSLGHDAVVDGRSIVDDTLRPAGRTRHRTSTWSAQDFDPLVSPSLKRHSRSASLSAPNSTMRPGPHPLPPGAGYGAPSWSAATSAVDLPTASALTTPDEVPVEGSQESGMPLMSQTSSKESHSPMSPSTPAGPLPGPFLPRYRVQQTPDVTETLRASSVQPGHEQSPSADYTISARSSAYFGTTILPMPTRTLPPTAIYPHTPARLSMRDVDSPACSSPVSPSAHRYFPHSAPPTRSHTRVSHMSTATSAALADLETYAASLSSSFAFPARPSARPTSFADPPLTAFPIRTSSRRQGSIPWFAADAPVEAGEHDMARDSVERAVFRTTSRPISWMPRQGSSGTLPDGVPQLTDLAVSAAERRSRWADVDRFVRAGHQPRYAFTQSVDRPCLMPVGWWSRPSTRETSRPSTQRPRRACSASTCPQPSFRSLTDV